MALRGYELLLFVRAQNQASSTLRRVANDVRALNKVTKTGAPLLQGAERMQAQGRLISHAGRTAQLAGLGVTAALGAAAKSAADFGAQVTLAASQARDLDAPLAQIASRAEEIDDQLKGLMRTFPASADEMANSAYEIYSGINLFEGGVVNTERALAAMTLANKAAVAGQADLADTTSLLITLANNFGDSEKEMAKNMDTAFDIIRFGRLHVSELNDMFNKIAPAAKAAGQNIEGLAGATAFLTTVIPSQRQVATGMSRLLDFLRHPDIVEGLKQFGVNVLDATGNARPFMQVMQEIVDTFPELRRGEVDATNFFRTISRRGRFARTGAPGLGLVSTIEGRRVFTQLISGWDQVLERQRQVEKNTNELNTAYSALSESAGVRFQRFINNLKRQLLDIGAGVIPVFEQIGEHLGRITKWWDTLDDSQRQNIVRWTAFAGVALLLGGALASIIGALSAMVGTFAVFFGARGLSAAHVGRAAKFVTLMRVLKGVGTIGSISLIIEAGLTGDVTAIKLLMGLVSGALAGFALGGPVGAIAGAIIVPVTMVAASELNKGGKSFMQQAIEDAQDAAEARMPAGREHWANLTLAAEQARDKIKQLNMWGAFEQNTKDAFMRMATAAYEAGKITAANFIAGMKLAGFSQAEIDKQLAAFTEAAGPAQGPLQEHLAIVKNSITRERTATKKQQTSQLKAWDKYFNDLAKYRNADKKHAIDNARIAADATKAAIDEVTGFLMQQYQEIEQANKDVMGGLFQGEWLTGEAAQISEEWGIKPQMKDLIKDLKMQMNQFNRFNSGLSAIAKRGGPPELIEELRKLGPAGLDQIETLKKASPKAWNEFINVYKRRNTEIDRATKIQFNKRLAEWKKHGADMMRAIISGLDAEHAKLEGYFRSMVRVWFPEFIASEVARAQADAARGVEPGPKKPTPPSGPDPRKRNARGQLPIVVQEGDISVTVYQQPGESEEDTLKRAAILLKNKARNKKPTPKKPKTPAKKPNRPARQPPQGTR